MSERLPTDFESPERIPSQEEMNTYADMENLFVRRHMVKMRISPFIDKQPVIDDWMRVYSGAFQIAFSNLVRKDADFLKRCQTDIDNNHVLDEIEAEFKKVKKLEGLE